MKTFKQYITERTSTGHSAHFFDLDETLFAHDHDKLKVHVNDASGKRVASLTNQQYNSHKLQPNHSYDYSEFKSTKTFKRSARPIRKMIAKLKAIHNNNQRVHIVSARSDFDDKEGLAKHLNKYGIDINRVRFERAGNLKMPTHEAKKKIISDLITKHGLKKVHLYDDHPGNLDTFLSLKKDHPDVEFHAHHIDHNPETGAVKVTTRKA